MRTLTPGLVLLFVACGALPPAPSPSFALLAPESVRAAPGGARVFELGVEARDGFDEPISLTAQVEAPLAATADGLRVKLEVPANTAAGLRKVHVTGTTRSGLTAEVDVPVEILPAFQAPTRAADVHLRLNALFYADGETARVVLDLGGRAPPEPMNEVVLVSSESNDVEKLTLRRRADGQWESESAIAVKTAATAGVTMDGTLTLAAGGLFVAFFPVDTNTAAYRDLESPLISDFGVLDGTRPGLPAARVLPELAMTDDERTPVAGARPVGTLIRPGAPQPLQLATRELVLFHRDDPELQRFLAASAGTLVRTEDVDGALPFASLVEVDPSSLTPSRLALARALAGETDELVASTPSAHAIYGLSLAFRLEGFVTAVNPRLQYQSAPALTGDEAATVNETMKLRGTATVDSCVPGTCTTSAPAVWAYLDLLELDARRVKVAVLDMGFAPTADFRPGDDGGITQCDFTGRSTRCGAGTALGAPTVGASLVGGRMWHGTGVVTALGGVVDNGFGAAGTGGQVVQPMLYKYDLAAYAFDMGRGIRQALSDGAQVINISAGYPCRIVTTVGPDFDICSVEGRLGICAVVTAAVHTAAVAFCTSPAAGIPIGGAIACAALTIGAIAATDACLATLALGDVRSTMGSAVNAALARGVPVVASAGNFIPRESLPEVIRDYVDLNEGRLEAWGAIPASLPGVIAVGAVDRGTLRNTQIFGNRVDLWAPTDSNFISPDDSMPGMTVTDEIGGTSGAAPYVTGVIAAMQAVNPSLDPARMAVSERAGAVARVRRLLVDTAHTDATLVARGFPTDARRRNLVSPIDAVLAAARGAQPDFVALGYDTTFNFSELTADDDVSSRARVLSAETNLAGTVLTFDSQTADEDWVEVRFPAGTGSQPLGADLVVRSLGDETPSVTSSSAAFPRVSSMRVGDETITTYRVVRNAGATVRFKVTAAGRGDVPYVLRLSTPVALSPTVTITEPALTPGQTVCANRPIQFRATGRYENGTTVTAMAWTIDGAAQTTTSLAPTFSRPAGTYTFTAAAFGGADSLSVTFANCTVQAVIVTPSAPVTAYFTDTDANGGYLPVSFTGRAVDAAGNTIDPATLVFEWTSDRGDVQPGAPSSGSQLLATGAAPGVIRLYCLPQPSTVHLITLTVRQSAGGPVLSTATVRVTVQNLI